jgi:predicted nucleic acid-binding protein
VIIADASWVISLRDPADRHHETAVATNEALGDEPAALPLVTFAECLVAPAALGVLERAATELRSAFHIVEPDEGAPLRWAALRARSGLRLPDAIVLDAALHLGARAIATFDDRLAVRARERDLQVLGGCGVRPARVSAATRPSGRRGQRPSGAPPGGRRRRAW